MNNLKVFILNYKQGSIDAGTERAAILRRHAKWKLDHAGKLLEP